MSDLDGVGINTLYSEIYLYLSKDILIPGIGLLGVMRILRAVTSECPYRLIWTVDMHVRHTWY